MGFFTDASVYTLAPGGSMGMSVWWNWSRDFIGSPVLTAQPIGDGTIMVTSYGLSSTHEKPWVDPTGEHDQPAGPPHYTYQMVLFNPGPEFVTFRIVGQTF